MSKRHPPKGADEHNCFCKSCRRFLLFRAGTRKRVKRKYNKRMRRIIRRELRDI